MENIDKVAQAKIVNLISVLLPDAKIYLFGSRARGTHRQWSDIDLALDTGVELPNVIVYEVKSVLEATNMPYKIDVLDFQSVAADMQATIKREKIDWKS